MFNLEKALGVARSIALTLVLASSGSALATDITVSSLGSVGAQDGLGIMAAPPSVSGCPFGYLYWDISAPAGKAMLTTLLTAKLTGQPVQIRYISSGYSGTVTQGLCTVQLVLLN